MKRAIAAAVLAACAGAVTVAFAVVGREGELAPGPMDKPQQHVWSVRASTGVPFTDGLETIVIKGKDPAEILGIEVDGDDSIDTLGFMLVGPDRRVGAVQHMTGWPPEDPELDQAQVLPALGTRMQTGSSLDGKGYELLIGHRVGEEGYFVRKGLWITYKVDDERYRQYLPAVLAICNRSHEGRAHCPAPKGWTDFPEH